MSAVVSGSMNVAQELGPESMPAAAKRSAKEIAKVFSPAFVKPGWIPPEKAKAQYQRADDPVARCELCAMDHQGDATALETGRYFCRMEGSVDQTREQCVRSSAWSANCRRVDLGDKPSCVGSWSMIVLRSSERCA